MFSPMTETPRSTPRRRPLATRSAGRRSSAAIRRSTASSCSPCARPESIAARAAPPGRPSGRTSRSSRPALKPRQRATAPANAAGPTSSARPIRKCRRSAQACERIETAEEAPKLAELAAGAGLSPYHFHRVFKAITGVTPKAYAAETRARRAADKLRTAETVTEAIYDAGFNSSSRFYENTTARLGMTPGAVRRGGAGAIIRFAVGEASLGAVLVAATDKGVCAITARRRSRRARARPAGPLPARGAQRRRRGIRAYGRQVVGLVEAPGQRLDLPLDIRGTAFQQKVWAALQRHPARQDGELRGDRPRHRPAKSRARRRAGLRREPTCDCDPMPSGGAIGRRSLRLSLGRRAQAQAHRSRGGVMKVRDRRLC